MVKMVSGLNRCLLFTIKNQDSILNFNVWVLKIINVVQQFTLQLNVEINSVILMVIVNSSKWNNKLIFRIT